MERKSKPDDSQTNSNRKSSDWAEMVEAENTPPAVSLMLPKLPSIALLI